MENYRVGEKEGRMEGGKMGCSLSWHFLFYFLVYIVNAKPKATDQEGSGVDHCRHLKLISSESANI